MSERTSLCAIRPWGRRQWLSMRRDKFTRREAMRSIARDVVNGFRAKYVRKVP